MRLFLSAILSAASLSGTATAQNYAFNFTAEPPILQFLKDTEAPPADDLRSLYEPGGAHTQLAGTIAFEDTFIASGAVFDTNAPISVALDGFGVSGVWPGKNTRVRDDGALDFVGTVPDVTSSGPYLKPPKMQIND